MSLNSATRSGAWLMAGVMFFGFAIMAMAIEDLAFGADADVVGDYAWPPMGVCFLTGVLSSLRAGVGWYVSEERWRRAGRVLKWVATPGNRDIAVSLVLILLALGITM